MEKKIKHGIQILSFTLALVLALSSCSIGQDTFITETPQISISAEPNFTGTLTPSEPETIQDSEEPTTVAESILFEENDVIIKTNGCEETNSSLNIGIYIENNSNLNLSFNAHAYAINGIMTGNNIYDMDCDVAAGKKANTILEIDKNVMNTLGVKRLKNIDVLFWAYDNDKYFKAFDTNQIFIPTNYNDDTYDCYTGTTVYSDKDVQVDYLGTDNGEYLYAITNSTGTYMSFGVENLSFNDYSDSSFKFSFFDTGIIHDLNSVIVLNGCQAIIAIKPDDDFININHIDEITKIEFSLNIRSEENYFEDWSTEPIITNSLK